MLRLAAVFFVIALIAALFGIGFAANFSLEGAKILFFVFLVSGAVLPGRQVAKANLRGLRADCLRTASLTSVHEPASNME